MDDALKYSKTNRIELLDGLRGIAIFLMVIYHLMYDLVNMEGMSIPHFNSGLMDFLHTFFIVLFFSVSGVCTAFSRNSVKRGAIVFFAGQIVTMATSVFLPSNLIVFGVLTFIGSMMMICGILKPVLDKINWIILLFCSVLLFAAFFNFPEFYEINLLFAEITLDIPRDINYLYPFGITGQGFFSADYFPLVPYGFIFLAGTALSVPIISNKFPKRFYAQKVPVFSIMGKYSLYIYILHQPLILLILRFV
jgi:uncharacterized membrane protein